MSPARRSAAWIPTATRPPSSALSAWPHSRLCLCRLQRPPPALSSIPPHHLFYSPPCLLHALPSDTPVVSPNHIHPTTRGHRTTTRSSSSTMDHFARGSPLSARPPNSVESRRPAHPSPLPPRSSRYPRTRTNLPVRSLRARPTWLKGGSRSSKRCVVSKLDIRYVVDPPRFAYSGEQEVEGSNRRCPGSE